MALKHRYRAASWFGSFCVLAVSIAGTRGEDGLDTREQVRELMQQNQSLQEQLRKQKEMIDLLTKQVSEIQEGKAQQSRKMEDLQLEVLKNPYFAATNDKGNYTIANVPAGRYKLKAWHERLPSRVEEVTVPERGEVKVDFTLGIMNLPKS